MLRLVSCLAKRWHQGKGESVGNFSVKDTVANEILNNKCPSKLLDIPAEGGHEHILEVDLARDPATQIT